MKCEVVISGMSGRFPESDNVAELSENLFNKVDLVTEDGRRFDLKTSYIPRRSGKIKKLDKFDNLFFNVHHRQSHSLDPQARILLEVAYEAVADAGYDPAELRGKNVGVYVGNCCSETSHLSNQDITKFKGYVLLGCAQSLFANRISYTFDLKGPSFAIDSGCSSSAMALYQAYKAIERGDCEAAIVGGANLCLSPETTLSFAKLKMISPNGISKSFDASCDGYARSEGIAALFLQKADVARRKYATIVNIKTNTDGFKEEGITYPSVEMQKRLMCHVLEDCELDGRSISYVEAHATGTPAGTSVELSAITDVFCKNRQEPLLLGCVKSNLGHTEPTSCICGVIKILIAMEKGLLPPDIHFKDPNPVIKDFIENNQIKIVLEPTTWNGPYALFNSFGFGGVNISGVLKRNPTVQNDKKCEDEKNTIPQIVLYCGRTEESVRYVLENEIVKRAPREFFALLHKLAYAPPSEKPHRGYALITGGENSIHIKNLPPTKRPVWYIFSGMGTQWPGMANDMMKIECFAKSIQRSARVLKEYNLDLMEMLINGLELDMSSDCVARKRKIIPAFVSIAAVQIALVDVLNELGLKPDGIVGHSVGELGCAYADGCITAEQMILSAYWRGKAVEDSQKNLIQGTMAAVGMTLSEAQERCPKDIYVSCHNAMDSLTLSGPACSMKEFMEKLNANNVFVREVNACGYAFHSDYILPAAEKLKEAMEKVIPNPKPRSSRWISSSYPNENWNDPEGNLAGSTYFVHNLISPVLFCEALHHVPKNAVVIEIGPHHLLQSILKREIGRDAEFIGLMKRNTNNSVHFLQNIGKLYTMGLDPDVEALYPSVNFPVPRCTPMISPLIKWNHSESWTVHKWNKELMLNSSLFVINPGPVISPEHFLLDHCIDGRYIYPASGYIHMACTAFARMQFFDDINDLSFEIKNIRFHRPTLLSQNTSTKFMVFVSRTTGTFEISESNMIVCTGCISFLSQDEQTCLVKNVKIDKKALILNSKDIYKEMTFRGYEYGPTFQGLIASDLTGKEGILKENDNWIVYLDNMLQFSMLKINRRVMLVPISIERLIFDPKEHRKIAEGFAKEYEGIPIQHKDHTREIFSGGMYIKNVTAGYISRKKDRQIPLLEEYTFMPYIDSCLNNGKDSEEEYASICISMAKRISNMLQMECENIDNISTTEDEGTGLIDEYLKSNKDNCVLLKCLFDIKDKLSHNEMFEDIKKYVISYIEERPNDKLSKTLTAECYLRPLIDIAIENMCTRKIKIVEITEGSCPLLQNIKKYIPLQEFFNLSLSVLHPDIEVMHKDQMPPNIVVECWENKPVLNLKDVDLLIFNSLNCSQGELKLLLENASECLKDEGFIILLQKTRLNIAEDILVKISVTPIPAIKEEDVERIVKNCNLDVICKRNDLFTSSLYLIRKKPVMSFKDSVIYITDDSYDTWVNELKTKMEELEKADDSSTLERIFLIREGSPNSGILGLVNCLRQEPYGSHLRCVFIQEESEEIPKFNLNHPFFQEQLSKNLAVNVYSKGCWGTYRHLRCDKNLSVVETEHAYLNVLTAGDLSSLSWIESPLKNFTSSEEEILCHVYYASLNFKDVMIASGKLPLLATAGLLALKDSPIGFEFSGRTYDGKRIMGLVSSKAMATTVTTHPSFILNVPDIWTLEEAATVPIAYGTAYYALIEKAKLQSGQKVLIHSGSGGVGQAAISIALHMGCEVYTSVGSEEKKAFLKKRFPQLKDKHFCNSRDRMFEQHILRETNGEGVDVVLNSLTEDKLLASLNCLAVNGCFLEIGKHDMIKNNALGMAIFLKNISFHGIALDTVLDSYKEHPKKEVPFLEYLKQGIADGVVKPLNTNVFNRDQAEEAFRFMASGRHTGKVLLKVRDEEKEKIISPCLVRVTAITRTYFDSKKSYIIIGGLGGFGLELCDWLVDRGAKNIILTSRKGITTGYQQLCMQRWKSYSANVIVSNLDASKKDEAYDLIKKAANYGEIGGIFILTMVLRDNPMVKQTVQNFIDVCDSKVEPTKNLDLLCRKFYPKLDWFVCFSSMSCGRGNPEQSNYGYANSVMERICEARKKDGMSGLAIQWGLLADVSIVLEKMRNDVNYRGIVPQRMHSCLNALDKFLHQTQPVVSSAVPYEPDEASKLGKGDLFSNLASIFGIKDISSINPEATLGELGLDSIMGVELKQILELHFNIILSVPEIRQLKVKDFKHLGEEGCFSNSPKNIENPIIDVNMFLGKFCVENGKVLLPEETIVHMNNISEGSPLFIIHPFEGSVHILQSLAEKLPCPVYGIQFMSEAPRDTIENLSAWYWKNITSMKLSVEYIYLAGYSFGATIAFEMALQAEQDKNLYPEVKNLILLDGSHNFFTIMAITLAIPITEEIPAVDEQIALLYAFSKMFEGEVKLDKKDVEKLNNYEGRIDYTAEKIAETFTNFTSEEIKILYHMFYKKLKMAFRYCPMQKLKSDLCLIKASESSAVFKNFSDLYDLEKVCEGSITAHIAKGTHTSFIQNDSVEQVSNIVKEIVGI